MPPMSTQAGVGDGTLSPMYGSPAAESMSPQHRTEKRSCEMVFPSWESTSGGSASFELSVDGEYQGDFDNGVDDDKQDVNCPSSGRHGFRLSKIVVVDQRGRRVAAGGYCSGSMNASDNEDSYTVTL